MKRPAFQFYPGDWQRDAALRSCSVGARGLWIEMICVMHQADPYGHLVVNERGIEPDTLARMVGASKREVGGWLLELEDAGVFSREQNVIVSRRMVRDESVRKARAEGGKLGGNPALKDNHKVGEKVNHPPNLQPTPSSSVLQSSSSEQQNPTALSGKPDPTPPDRMNGHRATAREILEFLNEKTGKQYKPVNANLELIVARLREGFDPDDIRAVIAKKCREWGGDDKMGDYLRPKTLFGRTNFANYEGELGTPAGLQ